jgi:integrase
MSKRANSEGSVYQRGSDGRWVALLPVPTGRTRSFYGKTQAEAIAKKNTAARQVADGLPIAPERLLVGQFLNTWLDNSARTAVRPKTYHGYQQIVRLHLAPGLGRIKLGRLTPQDVQAFVNAKAIAISPSMAHRCHAVLRLALAQAERWGSVPRNVAKLVTVPRVARAKVNPFTIEEAQRFIASAHGDRFEALFVTTLACGLRQGEALALRWGDVDLAKAEIRVKATLQRVDGDWLFAEPKSKESRRLIPVPQVAVRALREHRTRQLQERLQAGPLWMENDLVFSTHTGGPLGARNVIRSFKAVLVRGDLRQQRFHDLRHGCASLLAASGASLVEAKEILGHSQISITADLYTHIFDKAKREAMDRLDRVLAHS